MVLYTQNEMINLSMCLLTGAGDIWPLERTHLHDQMTHEKMNLIQLSSENRRAE